jgi:Mg2+/Co2+ transporter CorB
MIQQIIAMLQLDNHYGISETVDIAKGKYKLHTSMKKAIKQGKRELLNKRNGRG